MTAPDLARLVFDALDNAAAGEYGELLAQWTIAQVACDLLDCDADLEAAVGAKPDPVATLLPHIAAWAAARGRAFRL